ncbi:MAG TPA: PPOX class F420-dependent oxidoreductase [Tepidiformaceae bacterium]|nr:PPOX class F420-dependent oxidoreductase [Tepidiformaceae bacterium]
MIGTAEQDAFISKNRWAVVTTLRSDGSPSSSVVFYAREGDEIIFSTTAGRLKARTLGRDPRVAVAVLDEGQPFGYVTVEGTARIQAEGIVEPHIAINKAMRRVDDFTPPEGFAERLERERRVVVRVTAARVSGVTNRG